MNEEQKRAALVRKIETRKSYDDKWARRDFFLAQAFLGSAILASFCTAILAATEAVPRLLLGFLAAIPGMAIIVDKNFSFARRARWHWEMVAKLDQLSNHLQFEDAKVEDVAKQLGVLRIEMEEKFPDMKPEGLPDNSPPGK